MPERLVEIELHSPSLNVRGTTAAGAPVIGIGHNEHVAWGVTSGLGDEDDLYAEELVGDEGYRFRGKTETMECRDETLHLPAAARPTSSRCSTWRSPNTSSGQPHRARLPDRPRAGPGGRRGRGRRLRAQATRSGSARSARSSGSTRSTGRTSIEDVDAAADELTWNENLMAADDRGNIGYWSPGLMPVRSKRWDERLPFPGTGGAEWKGLLPPDDRPQVINPSQGWLANWNNPPSFGSTNGDGPAKERTIGGHSTAASSWRASWGASTAAGPASRRSSAIDRISGTHAQQRMLSTRAG